MALTVRQADGDLGGKSALCRFLVLEIHVERRFPHGLYNFIEAYLGSLFIAQLAAVIAFIAPIELRSIHGTCTSPATGSHVRPR